MGKNTDGNHTPQKIPVRRKRLSTGGAALCCGLLIAVFGAAYTVLESDWSLWVRLVLAGAILCCGVPVAFAIMSFIGDPGENNLDLRKIQLRLRQGGYRFWYRGVHRWLEGLVTARLYPDGGRGADSYTYGFHWRLCDLAMLWAVVYPFLLIALQWIFLGGAARIGDFEVIPAEPSPWPRALLLTSILLALSGPLLGQWAAASPKHFWRSVSGWLPFVTFAFSVTFAFAIVITFTFAFAVTFAFAFAFAFAFSGIGAFAAAFAAAFATALSVIFSSAFPFSGACSGAFTAALAVTFATALVFAFSGACSGAFTAALAVTFAGVATVTFVLANSGAITFTLVFVFAFAGTIAGILFLSMLAESGRGHIAIMLTLFVTSTLPFIIVKYTAYWSLSFFDDPRVTQVLLFLIILPVLNALFDFFSYAVTLTLIRIGPRLGWGGAFLLALLDFIIALALFALLGCAILLYLHVFHWFVGREIYSITQVLTEIGDPDLAGDYWWIYAMLFSTLLPTLLHYILAASAIIGSFPYRLRRWLRQLIARRSVTAQFVAATVYGIIQGIPIFGALVCIYLLAMLFFRSVVDAYLVVLQSFDSYLTSLIGI